MWKRKIKNRDTVEKKAANTVKFQPPQGSNICNLTLSCEIHLGNIDQDPFSLPWAIRTFLDSVYVQK